jgi:hypothetical protein
VSPKWPNHALCGAVAELGVVRFVVVMGNRILVTVPDGKVFAQDIKGNTSGPEFQLS